MRREKREKEIVVYPEGRIDSTNSEQFLNDLKSAIEGMEDYPVEINMENVEYVSSAGLRVFLQLKKGNLNFCITELSLKLYETFSLTGFTEILDVRKAIRRISVDGCRVIGDGFSGVVYRIDEDTIVKVYHSADSINTIKNEQQRAKQAFIKGIPTPISFDLVRVGDKYGLVFELLDARTFNDIIVEEPERTDEIIKVYADFLKKIHSIEMDPDSIPYAAEVFSKNLDLTRKYLSDEDYTTLKKYLSEFPKDDHFVHADIQMKNVMMANGEPMMIDMEMISAGHPIFDFAGIYTTYCAFREDEPGNSVKFLGYSDETADHIWQGIIKEYFKDKNEEELADIINKITLAGVIRFLYILEAFGIKNNEYGEIRIRHCQEHIRELLGKVDGLYFQI